MSALRRGAILGSYRVLAPLPSGRGGFAQVYLAKANMRGREFHEVALKVARARSEQADTYAAGDSVYNDAIKNEVNVLKQLRHPNIVHIYPILGTPLHQEPYIARAVGFKGEPWYFVMEYLRGPTLEKLIEKRGRLPIEEAVEAAVRIGMAVDFMHSKGIRHLDIKPSNVLFRRPVRPWSSSFEPVLIDFGIAAGDKQPSLDAGAIPYLPPERLRVLSGELAPRQVGDDKPVDVYQLGMLLYKMVTGQMPFHGSKGSITMAVHNDPPMPPHKMNHEVSPQLEDLILRALAKDPQKRPRIHEMVMELDTVLQPPRMLVNRMRPQSLIKRYWRRTIASGVCVLILILILCAGFGNLSSFDYPTPVPSLTWAPTVGVSPCVTYAPTITEAPIPTHTRTLIATQENTPTLAPTRTPTPPLPTNALVLTP